MSLKLIQHKGTQVLWFDDTSEARAVGAHLAAMGEGCRFYAIGAEGSTPDQRQAAIDRAVALDKHDKKLLAEYERLAEELTA